MSNELQRGRGCWGASEQGGLRLGETRHRERGGIRSPFAAGGFRGASIHPACYSLAARPAGVINRGMVYNEMAMLIYLDMCCLKRPFDDQSQPRNRIESEIVLSLLAKESSDIRFVRSSALILENDQNPVRERALRVGNWLLADSAVEPSGRQFASRIGELMDLGFRNFDALHLASAEEAGAGWFVTCDDRLLKVAARNLDRLKLRVISLIAAGKELMQ